MSLDDSARDAIREQARSYMYAGMVAEAMPLLLELENSNGLGALGHQLLGIAYAFTPEMGQLAMGHFEAALQLGFEEPAEVHLHRGWYFLRIGSPALAVPDLAKAVELAPENMSIRERYLEALLGSIKVKTNNMAVIANDLNRLEKLLKESFTFSPFAIAGVFDRFLLDFRREKRELLSGLPAAQKENSPEQVAPGRRGSKQDPLPSGSAVPAPARTFQRLCFTHIQKTGGTSLKEWLARRVPEAESLALDAETACSTPRQAVERARLVHGHVNFTDLYALAPDAAHISLIREPIARTISLFRFWKRLSQGDPRHGTSLADHDAMELCRVGTLRDFLRSENPVILDATADYQARQLIAASTWDRLAPDALMERLKRQVARFFLIAPLEQADLMARALAHALDWQDPPPLGWINRTDAERLAEEADPSVRDLIAERVQLDIALHAHVAESFADRVARGLAGGVRIEGGPSADRVVKLRRTRS